MTRQEAIVKSGQTDVEAAVLSCQYHSLHVHRHSDSPSVNEMGPFPQYLGPMAFQIGNGKLYPFFNSWVPVSVVKVQRKYIPITEPLEIREIGEVTQCSSRSKPLCPLS